MFNFFFQTGLRRKGAILAYHSIGENGLPLTVSMEEFSRQIEHLKQRKYTVLPLSEMCERLLEKKPVKGCVAIAFYDGYSDFFTHAFPVLKRNNFPATVFLIPKKLGQEVSPDKDKEGLRIMSGGDVKRASATNDLIEFMPHIEALDLFSEDLFKEVDASRTAIEKLTLKPADIFAYPEGASSSNIAEYLRKSNDWLAGLSENAGFVEKGSDLFNLPRILVDSEVDLPSFKKKLS